MSVRFSHFPGVDPGFCRGGANPKGVTNLLLSTANEVLGKVICLHLSVILSMGGAWSGEVCSQGDAWSRGVPGPRGVWWRPPQTATAAGGMHPTGMHSCSVNIFTKTA